MEAHPVLLPSVAFAIHPIRNLIGIQRHMPARLKVGRDAQYGFQVTRRWAHIVSPVVRTRRLISFHPARRSTFDSSIKRTEDGWDLPHDHSQAQALFLKLLIKLCVFCLCGHQYALNDFAMMKNKPLCIWMPRIGPVAKQPLTDVGPLP
jgi:hypothetical protein